MKRLLNGTGSLLFQFEHATVVVVGVEYVVRNCASLSIIGSTLVLLALFHVILRRGAN